MLKKPPLVQEILKGGTRLRTGVVLVGWGFSASMALLIAVSAYQNRAPDPFSQPYAGLALPAPGDIETTASIGTQANRPTEFGVFSDPGPARKTRPGRFEAEIETLRHEIVALRRSSDALRRQNDIMSDRLAMIEGGENRRSSPMAPSTYEMPTRLARAPARRTIRTPTASRAKQPRGIAAARNGDPMMTGSIGKKSAAMGDASSAPRTKFAIDLGAYGTLAEVARAWHAMRATEARVIGTLSPLAAVSQNGNTMVAHLVAGPFVNAADAAAACARLEKRLIDCKPTLYTGQPLPAR